MGPVCDEKFKRISEITNGEIRQCLRLHFQHHQLCNGAAHQLLRRSHHLLSSQLRKQPKYLMKINASICSLFTLLTDGFESAYYIEPSQELCHASVFTLGWSNIFLLFNTLLALIDCWLEMTKPKFYAENVLSSILNAMLIFLLDWVYIFGVEPVRCAFQSSHHFTAATTWFLLLFSCIGFAISIYVKTKSDVSVDDLTEEEALDMKMKMKSARQFLYSLISFLILPVLTLIVASLPAFICMQFYPPDSDTCSTLTLIATYDNKIMSLNSTISPLIGMCTDPQLYSPIVECVKPPRPRPHADIIAVIRLNNLMKTTAV